MKELKLTNNKDNIIKENSKIIIDKKLGDLYFIIDDNVDKLFFDVKVESNIVLLFNKPNYKNKITIEGKVLKDITLNIRNFVFTENLELNQKITLDKENSKVFQKTLVFAKSKTKQDITFEYINNKQKTLAHQDVLVIGNNSKTKIDCTGTITKTGFNSESHQFLKGINQNDSKIELNPVLIIEQNEVIASHAATCGFLNEEELFYLMSRGISKENAEKLLIEGLLKPFLDNVKEDTLKTITKYIGV